MSSALIGYSGFVGSTLLRQRGFDALYRSSTIQEIADRHFDLVICAGAPAQKWVANRNPQQDRDSIETLIRHLRTIQSGMFILISTVDVFRDPAGVDETSPVDRTGLHPYGLHRRILEEFVVDHFPHHLIMRLPGLVGPGLRKNVIFDFHKGNNLHAIDSRGVFQFYPMVNLWYDIQKALQEDLRLLHLTAAPISIADVSRLGFGRPFDQILDAQPARYDMQTQHAAAFGASGRYQYKVHDTVQAIRAYAQSEPVTLQASSGERP